MKSKKILNVLRTINQEKMLASFHDELFLQDNPEVDALNSAIILINFLSKRKPTDTVTVTDLLDIAEIEQ